MRMPVTFMSVLRTLPPTAALALVLVAPSAGAEEKPQLLPTRDVDITYDVTRPPQTIIRERVRWLASEHLERVDGPGRSTTIFNRGANEITLLSTARRTYTKLEGAARRLLDPEPGAVLKRGSEAVVAGLRCTDWSWTEDVETHTVCATADGVLLRLIVDGKTAIEARSVRYATQKPELFQVPPDYTPALAPDGSAES
jgi:hypothetical protein